jgi:ATP-dependent DNA ligase
MRLLAFIHPCRPKVAERPPTGPGWVHELKHDGAFVICPALGTRFPEAA